MNLLRVQETRDELIESAVDCDELIESAGDL